VVDGSVWLFLWGLFGYIFADCVVAFWGVCDCFFRAFVPVFVGSVWLYLWGLCGCICLLFELVFVASV
jgi:hypothetical protein